MKNGKRFNNNGETTRSTCSESPISNGLQNIALAHLLVTHILLWLMKLNSISLFQIVSVDQYQHQHQHQYQYQLQYQLQPQLQLQRQQVQLASVDAMLNNNRTTDNIQSTGPNSVKHNDADDEPNEAGSESAAEAERRSRVELESILRRKSAVEKQHSSQSNFQMPNTSTVRPSASPNDHSTTVAGTPKAPDGQQVPSEIRSAIANATGEIAPSGLPVAPVAGVGVGVGTTSQVKSERGLRSASPSGQHSAPRAVNLTEHQVTKPNSIGQQPPAQTPSQLDPLDPVQQVPSVAPIANTSSTRLFKSSLPKRMTKFRQGGKVYSKSGPSSAPAPAAATGNEAPKQRVRVLVSRDEGVGDDSNPSSEPAEPDVARPASGSSATGRSERPFPSVDSDPPPSRGVLGATEHEASSTSPSVASQPRPAADQTRKPSEGEADEEQTGGDGDNEKQSEPKVGALEETEEDSEEPDLDSLLPPIPNYNDTTSASADEEPEVADKPQPLKAAPPVRLHNETHANRRHTKPSEPSPALLSEDPFVFTEAASTSNATLAPPPKALVDSDNSTRSSADKSASVAPVYEALIMPNPSQTNQQLRQQAQTDRTQQSSFADYLLPIVHQYHILIIAILFNMWLDSLRKKKLPAASCTSRSKASGRFGLSRGRVLLARDHLKPVSGFSSSSDQGSSHSTRGLIAIPIKSNACKSRRRQEQLATEAKHLESGLTGSGSYALEHRNNDRWARAGAQLEQRRRHHRSRSMDFLHQQQALLDGTGVGWAETGSQSSSLSRYNSLRSSSSERLLWIPSSQLKPASQTPRAQQAAGGQSAVRKLAAASYSIQSRDSTLTDSLSEAKLANSARYRSPLATQLSEERLAKAKAVAAAADLPRQANSVCSLFFGLLIVSGSLIVILLGVDLLSTLVQCATQLVSILACLLGLCLIWRHQSHRKRATSQLESGRHSLWGSLPFQLATAGSATEPLATANGQTQPVSHRQCFHYLFLLAAYYCGISIALNLNRQHSLQQLFSQQVLHFLQRHLSHSTQLLFGWPSSATSGQQLLNNYLFLFHALLAIKGLLLILQVTLQTVLIRSSCQRATKELRQVYTFLMFANLSLWAMEICEQQQHLQRRPNLALQQMEPDFDKFRLVTLDSFSRFAASIVTLSHLYHGLVFMQH